MSQIVRGILGAGLVGAVAIAGSLGAAQLAMGRDIGEIRVTARDATVPQVSPGQKVNRTSKSDRAALPPMQPGQTVGVKLMGQSVLVRIPADHLGDAVRTTRDIRPNVPRKMVVACEPVVSVLTEVAKSLQPGRCVA
jgi:hypothetical protein